MIALYIDASEGGFEMRGCPVLEVNLAKIAENANRVITKCGEKGIDVIGVTKGFSAAHQIVAAMVAGGINGLADARMENIIELRNKKLVDCKMKLNT